MRVIATTSAVVCVVVKTMIHLNHSVTLEVSA